MIKMIKTFLEIIDFTFIWSILYSGNSFSSIFICESNNKQIFLGKKTEEEEVLKMADKLNKCENIKTCVIELES